MAKSIVPPRVEYRLTASAQELQTILGELGRWSAKENLQAQIVPTA